ncbi:MAG TPA: ATP-binding protein [Steroidobacteraceae bacterium]
MNGLGLVPQAADSEGWRLPQLPSILPSVDLLDALRRPEGKTLEFKRDLSSPEGLLRTVVAFANTSGGVVLIGVEDALGTSAGLRTRSLWKSGSPA